MISKKVRWILFPIARRPRVTVAAINQGVEEVRQDIEEQTNLIRERDVWIERQNELLTQLLNCLNNQRDQEQSRPPVQVQPGQANPKVAQAQHRQDKPQ